LKNPTSSKDQSDEKKPQKRVLAAIGRKQAGQIDTLADRHGVVTRTLQNWLNRFEDQSIKRAPYDAPQPGSPARIDREEREQLFEQL
jgi:transposase